MKGLLPAFGTIIAVRVTRVVTLPEKAIEKEAKSSLIWEVVLKTNNILLLHPFSGKRTFCPPLGILYVAASLREAGYGVTVLDLDTNQLQDSELAALLREKKPLFTGISCNVVQVNEVLRLSRVIKEGLQQGAAAPCDKSMVVVGGPMPSAFPELFLEDNCIDICVIGEGEGTIVELAGALANELPLTETAGLALKGSDERSVIKTPPRDFTTELDNLPFPAHDLNGDINRYALNPSPAPNPPIAAVLPSRGCPFRCTFCSNPWLGTNRKRSVENVIREIEWLVSDFGIKEIFFYDDSFNSDPDYVKELCTSIIESGIKISWRADCRANHRLLDEETLRLMKESGCWLLAFGIETGNQEIMRSIRKGLKLEDVRLARDLCKKAGILFRSFFMIGNLGEDYRTVFDTIKFARELDPDDCQFSMFTPVIGTPAYETARKNGLIVPHRTGWENLDSFHATVSTDRLSAEDVEVLHKLAVLTVPNFWAASLRGVRPHTEDISARMKEAYGRKGQMIYELWGSCLRNGRVNKPRHGVVVLNPPSPPGFTSSKDTMGGLGQVFKGDFLPVIPPVDMACLASRLRSEGAPVHAVDAVGSRLDVQHTMKFLASLSPARVIMRTSAPTREWDRSLGERIAGELNVEVEYFGPCVEGSPGMNLKGYPLPAWELFPDYNLGPLTCNRRYLPIQGSVGCPYGCDYCPYPVAQGTEYVAREPERVADEMLHWKRELGVDYFLFRDPVFSMRQKWVEKLCRHLKGQGVNWRCETRADLLPDELLERMAEAGCAGINLGIETATESCLDKVHRKPIPVEKLKAVVRKCKELRIETFVFYIAGLPGETRESFLRTLDLARELDTPHVQFLPATPYPGTILEQWAGQRGFITGSLTDPAHYGTEPVMRNEHLTPDEIKELCETANRTLSESSHSVAAAKCLSYDAVGGAVKKVVDELGGMEAFVKPGQRVLIKPNLIGPYPPDKAATTHPSVVEAVAALVKSAGGIPIIGDSPGGGEVYLYKNYRNLLRVTGIDEAARRAGCDTIDFSSAGVSRVPVNGEKLQEVVITEAALQADLIISVPKVKTHAFQYFTGAVKNLYGLVPGLKKAEYHKMARSPQDFAPLIVDIFQCVKDKVRLVIMDGVLSMDGRGPTAGRPVKTDFILASREPVVADAAACLILGLDPKQSPIIAEALQRFYKGKPINIDILGESPADLKVSSFQPPFYESQDSFIEAHANIYPYLDQTRCKQCRKCIESCPVQTIRDDFVVETDDCIKCLCCFEVCPHNAIELVKQLDDGPPITEAVETIHEVSSTRGSSPLRGESRVLVLSNLYPPHFIGGYELACREIAEKLRGRGHQVRVLTSMFGLDSPAVDGHVHRILDHSYGAGDGAFFLDMPFSAYNEYLIKKVMEEFKPHVLYLWNFHGLSMHSVMSTIIDSGIPYVFHAMDYHLLPGFGSLQKWQEPLAARFLSSPRCKIVPMSETVRTKFLRQGYLNTHLVYHGVDVTPLNCAVGAHGGAPFPAHGSTPSLRLLFTGQIRHGKGLHVVIQAVHAVCQEGHRVTLDVFGKGDPQYEEELRRFTVENRLPVNFHGPLPRHELLKEYSKYDTFVCPTLREEPFGIVMIEAMNAGLPVIASGEGGPKEIITHGETGLWFPAGDHQRLKECMIQLASSKELRRKLSENGHALVGEKFDIEKSVSSIERLLGINSELYQTGGANVDGKSAVETIPELSSTEELMALLKEHPDDPTLHNRLGEALFGMGEHEKARQEFEIALTLDNHYLDAHNNLGAVLYAEGEFEEAMKKFNYVLEKDENNIDALVNCGMACAQSGRDEEAAGHLQKYLSMDGEDLEARLTLSEVLNRMGRKKEAQGELQKILRTDPENEAIKKILTGIEQS